jgi:hypothetical protein
MLTINVRPNPHQTLAFNGRLCCCPLDSSGRTPIKPECRVPLHSCCSHARSPPRPVLACRAPSHRCFLSKPDRALAAGGLASSSHHDAIVQGHQHHEDSLAKPHVVSVIRLPPSPSIAGSEPQTELFVVRRMPSRPTTSAHLCRCSGHTGHLQGRSSGQAGTPRDQ